MDKQTAKMMCAKGYGVFMNDGIDTSKEEKDIQKDINDEYHKAMCELSEDYIKIKKSEKSLSDAVESLRKENKKLESKIKEQADKLNKCNSFIRTLKSLSKKGEDISYLLETHNAKYLQMRYNKYDLIFNEFNNYYGVLENTDENIDINYANKQLIDKIEVIFNTEVK